MWQPVHTVLKFHRKTKKLKLKLITSVFTQFKVNKLLMAAPGLPVKAKQSKQSLTESALYIKSQEDGLKGCKGHGRNSEECDWGNTNE